MKFIFLLFSLMFFPSVALLNAAQSPIFITQHAQNLHDDQYKTYALCYYYQKQLPKKLGLFKDVLSFISTKALTELVLEYNIEETDGALDLIRSVDHNDELALHQFAFELLPRREHNTRHILPIIQFSRLLDGYNKTVIKLDTNSNLPRVDQIMDDTARTTLTEAEGDPATEPYGTRVRDLISLSSQYYQEATENVNSYWQERESERQRFITDAQRVTKEKTLLSKLTRFSQYAPWLLSVISLTLTHIAEEAFKILANDQDPQLDKKRIAKYLGRVTMLNTYLTKTVSGISKATMYAILNNIVQNIEYYHFSNAYSHNPKSWPSVTRFVSLPHLTVNYILFDITCRCWHYMCKNSTQKYDDKLRTYLSNYEYDDLKRTISNAIKVGVPMYMSLEGIRRRS